VTHQPRLSLRTQASIHDHPSIHPSINHRQPRIIMKFELLVLAS
jgi:hypothetical protein